MEKNQTNNYFSYENLRDLSGLDEHIEFIEEVIAKYDWNKTTLKNFNKKLKGIKDKQNDKLLNISIIGEFSTGKSTFINALLRTELLTSDVIQGTTVSNTIIAYDKDYRLKILYKNSKATKLKFDSLDELKEKIATYTSNPEEAKKIKSVEIYLPAESLKDRYRIIDTPGTNSTDEWHEDVTRNALRELSDISLILTAADKLLPDSFCDFVEENIADVLPQCAFVVTKIDTVRPKERKRISDYINMKIKNRFEIENPVVFSYSSLDILNGDDGKNTDLIKESLENEQKIFDYTGKTRMVVQTKKLLSMTDDIYDFIMPKIEKMKSLCESKLQVLLNSKQANLDDFVEEQMEARINDFKDSVREYRNSLKDIISEVLPSYQESVYDDIRSQSSSDNILAYIERNMSDVIHNDSMELIQKVSDDMYSDVFEIYSDELAYFCEQFEEYFRDMDLLEMQFESGGYVQPNPPKTSASNFDTAAKAVAEEIKKEDKALIGGTAGGAAIGTALLPGIGTILGGAIGFIAGASSIDVGKTKQIAINKIQTPLYNHYNGVKSQLINSLDNYVNTLCGQLEEEIFNYLCVYKEEVDRRIEEEEEAEKQMQEEISSMLADINAIDKRKEKMNDFRKLVNQQQIKI